MKNVRHPGTLPQSVFHQFERMVTMVITAWSLIINRGGNIWELYGKYCRKAKESFTAARKTCVKKTYW